MHEVTINKQELYLDQKTKEQFLSVADQIYIAIKDANEEARKLSAEYHGELKNKKKVKYYDYEMFVVTIPYLDTNAKHPKTIDKTKLGYDFVVWQKNDTFTNKNLFESKELNWNIEELEMFSANEYINYYMHILVSHLGWTIEDITKIDHLFIKTVISFQRRWRKDKVLIHSKVVKIRDSN